MKKLLAMLLAFYILLSMNACSSQDAFYSAIPELKISWEMSPEEAIKSCPANLASYPHNSGGSFLMSDLNANLPEICGLPLMRFSCFFDSEGTMLSIKLDYDPLKVPDYSEAFSAYEKEYGSPTFSDTAKSYPVLSSAYAGWELETASILIESVPGGKQLASVWYYPPSNDGITPTDITPDDLTESSPSEAEDEAAADASEDNEAVVTPEQVLEFLQGNWTNKDDASITLSIRTDGTISCDGMEYAVEEVEILDDEYFLLLSNENGLYEMVYVLEDATLLAEGFQVYGEMGVGVFIR